MKLITCEICGKQELRHDQAFTRLCFDCARKRNSQRTLEAYYRRLRGEVKEKHCKVCGCVIEHHQRYCDKCRAEHYRNYQREYKRRIRAKK